MLLIPLSTGPVTAVALVFLMALAGFTVNPVVTALAVRFAGDAPTPTSVLTTSAYNTGIAAGSALAGTALDSSLGLTGPALVGALSATLTLLPLIALALTGTRRPARIVTQRTTPAPAPTAPLHRCPRGTDPPPGPPLRPASRSENAHDRHLRLHRQDCLRHRRRRRHRTGHRLAFARAGARVALADLSGDGLRETARLIEADGSESLTLTCDVTSEDDVQAAVDRTVEHFGSLDAAFNNAGVEQPVQSAADTTKDDWDRILGVSLTGAFLCTRAQIRQMLRQDGGGAIVNVSSGAGIKRFQDQGAYAAAKHGIIGFTRSAALDHAAQGIRINAVYPGIIDTEMIRRFGDTRPGGREGLIVDEPVGRLVTPEEILRRPLALLHRRRLQHRHRPRRRRWPDHLNPPASP